MASVYKREELVLPLDWDIIDASNGFTFDIGGSVIKLLYVSTEDWKEPKYRKKGSKGHVRLVNYSREDLDEALNFINTKVRIHRKSRDDVIQVYSTGIGGTEFGPKFKEQVNAKLTNLAEFDCFSRGFVHMLENIPASQLIHPPVKPAFQTVKKSMDQAFIVMSKMKGKTGLIDSIDVEQAASKGVVYPQLEKTWSKGELMTTQDDLFPAGLVICGSGFAVFQVNKDGTFQMVDGSNRGGKFFLGLGSLLTGAKTYPALLDLCTKGRSSKVSVTSATIRDSMPDRPPDGGCVGDNQDDLYQLWMNEEQIDETVTAFFGKGAGKTIGDFQTEDIARSLLESTVTDLVQVSQSAAHRNHLKHVFFSEGFVDHPLVRNLISLEWLRRDTSFGLFDPRTPGFIQAHFLVHGQSLGALGAFLNHKQQWSEKMKQQAPEAVAVAASVEPDEPQQPSKKRKI